jgi:hypothetical protein
MGFAFDNHIDFNLSSGNYAEGVGISSCPPGDVFNNHVLGNYLGTDCTGSVDLGNVHDGLYIGEGAHDNLIDNNLISGNDYEGVCIIGYPPYGWDSHSNIVYGNIIGLDIALAPLGNTMDGVSIGQYGNYYQGGYATANIVDSNIIAHNGHNGVSVWEHSNNNFNCDFNWITQNTMYTNGGLGIDLNDDGVTPNDANDPDTGANEELNFPVITAAGFYNGTTTVNGTIDIDTDPTQATVEVFRAAVDPSGYGEGWIYLGPANPDAAGNWQFVTTMLNMNDDVTATTTDQTFNTSEFCNNVTVVVGISESRYEQPGSLLLLQCYPNPFREEMRIAYSVKHIAEDVTITIYDIKGSIVKRFPRVAPDALHISLVWDGRDAQGDHVPPGVYFLQALTPSSQRTLTIVRE